MNTVGTVYVVDDDRAMRDSLRWLIESVGLAVRTFDSAEAFLRGFDLARPSCLLLDVRMPGMSGLELQAQLSSGQIDLPVILITGHGDVTMAVAAMKAGAVDFIEKPFDDSVLLRSIRDALAIDGKRRAWQERRDEIDLRLAELTPREREVLDMVTDGLSNREIAAALGVSTKTIETHRSRMMDKMNAGSLAELVRITLSATTTDD